MPLNELLNEIDLDDRYVIAKQQLRIGVLNSRLSARNYLIERQRRSLARYRTGLVLAGLIALALVINGLVFS
jgi:hypothetical protein